jgi:hypothetical protein
VVEHGGGHLLNGCCWTKLDTGVALRRPLGYSGGVRLYRFKKGSLMPFLLWMTAIGIGATGFVHLLVGHRDFALGVAEIAFAGIAWTIVRLGTRRHWFGWTDFY